MTKKRRRLIAASCFSLALWAAGAGANDSGVRVFPPSYFDAFDPETALDLAQNTPGFQLQAAGGGRSLSGARSNILIDAARPPAKGRSVTAILRDLPLRRVERVELIQTGARPGLDMQLSQSIFT